jgi:hypothetical protein
VRGADGRIHLAYEIRIANKGPSFVTIDQADALGPRGTVRDRIGRRRLPGLLALDGSRKGVRLDPGIGATLFLNVTIRRGGSIPTSLRERFRLSLRAPAPPSGPGAALEPGPTPAKRFTFTMGATPVRHSRPVVLAPPLRGAKWVMGNGCCEPINAHRGALLPVNGTIHAPERFAIDFIQLDSQNRMFTGHNVNSSYPFFGDPIYAAASGRVVDVRNDLPDEVPGHLPPNSTLQTADGNYVVESLGHHRWALYAHMQTGSVDVHRGERIHTGQVLGSLGNSGNTDAPHLHFQVMNSPKPLVSNGLPFVFGSFTGQGVVRDVAPLYEGHAASVDRHALAGRHRAELPLDNELVNFGDH